MLRHRGAKTIGGVTVRTLDLRSIRRWFDSRSGLTTRMGDCGQVKPSRYVTNYQVNSAIHPSGVGKSSTGLSGWG